MYGAMEESTPAAAPALGPEELKAVRELLSTTTGDDARPAGLLHEPQELSTSTLTKLEAAADEVELQASVWDASLFLFNPVAGRSASVFAFFLLVVNVFMQGSFAFYLINGLDEKPLTNDDVNELKWWRRHVAHSLEFYNEEKGESLARRVCDGDYGVEGSGVQLSLHEVLNDYLGDYFHPRRDGVYNIGVGPGGYLCMLAVCLWVITVCIVAAGASAATDELRRGEHGRLHR